MNVSETDRDLSSGESDALPEVAAMDPAWMRFARSVGVDGAVGFAVLARFWQLLTGPVTQLLIIFCFTEVEQGYYYAFVNLLAMQIFVELGLHVVIINVASHEWSGLQLAGRQITGDSEHLSRLVSLGRRAFQWYGAASAVFVTAVSVFGIFFFLDIQKSQESLATFEWMVPWVTLVLLTGLQFVLLPLTAILEGCGQLSVINRVRFWQNVAGSFVVWLLMSSGFGLWALCGSAVVRLAGEAWLVMIRYRDFFRPFRTAPTGAVIQWSTEVLPLQWRMAVQGVLLWLSTHLAGLVVLKYHGAAVSGRFGMMWTVLSALQAAALAWVETRRPLFGQLIASRDYRQLDLMFMRLTRISMLLIFSGNLLFTVAVWVVRQLPYGIFERIADRLPTPLSIAVFAAALVIFHLAHCTNIYVRAHKRDPYLPASVMVNPIVAGLVFWGGRNHGIMGVGLGYFVGVALIQTPVWMFIWARTRQSWHAEEPSS